MFKMTHVSSDLSPTRFLDFKRYHYSLILIYHAVLTFGVIEKAGLWTTRVTIPGYLCFPYRMNRNLLLRFKLNLNSAYRSYWQSVRSPSFANILLAFLKARTLTSSRAGKEMKTMTSAWLLGGQRWMWIVLNHEIDAISLVNLILWWIFSMEASTYAIGNFSNTLFSHTSFNQRDIISTIHHSVEATNSV